jgi:hypothetical protein
MLNCRRRSVMAGDELLQTYPSPDGKRWIELRKRPDGRFYFQEFYEATDNVPEYGPDTYTSPGWKSGLYESAAAAESDLQKMAPWLSEKSS